MLHEEILKKVIEHTKEGCYYKTFDKTVIKTIDGIIIVAYDDATISFFVPTFDENIAEYVISKKYGDYELKDIDENTLVRILELFKKRLHKSYEKLREHTRVREDNL